MSENNENEILNFPYWIICHGVEKLWYLSQTPNIQFTDDLASAVRLTKADAIATIDVLADMQRMSSFTNPESYTLTCVKK